MLVQAVWDRLGRQKFQEGHFDGVIRHFREIEVHRGGLDAVCGEVVDAMIAKMAGVPEDRVKDDVHVLELAAEGVILPHVDNVRFIGEYVVVLNLVSDVVVELTPSMSESSSGGREEEVEEKMVRMYVPRRSLYVLSGPSRYHWAHSIPANPKPFPLQDQNVHIHRNRRLSFIVRDD